MSRTWTLREKLGLMALVFVLSILANLGLSGFAMLAYIKPAFLKAESLLSAQQQIEQVRSLVRQQRQLFEKSGEAEDLRGRQARLEQQVESLLPQIEAAMISLDTSGLWEPIRAASHARGETLRRFNEAVETGADHVAALAAVRPPFVVLDERLSEAVAELGLLRHHHVVRASGIQRLVVVILIANTGLGSFLCLLGLWFVRRWVVLPVGELRSATSELAGGNFAVQLALPGGDEIGQLGREVNQMAARVVEMQEQLVERERRTAASDMVTRLEENLQPPLARIRQLAESAADEGPPEHEITRCQQRIIHTVDRFQSWLHELHRSMSPTPLELQQLPIRALIDDVTTVLRPLLERTRVEIAVQVDPLLADVRLDRLQMEQVLLALVTNAIEVSRPGQVVRIQAGPADRAGESWELVVADEGPGIPPDLLDKVFLPFFTTKKDGNGIGLAMAGAVVRLHGGRLSVQSQPGVGTRFTCRLPGMAPA